MPELENPFPEATRREPGGSRTASLALGGAALSLALAVGLLAAFLSARQDIAALQDQVTQLEQLVSAVAGDIVSAGDRLASPSPPTHHKSGEMPRPPWSARISLDIPKAGGTPRWASASPRSAGCTSTTEQP